MNESQGGHRACQCLERAWADLVTVCFANRNSFGGREKALEEKAKAGLGEVKNEVEKLVDKGKAVVEKITK